MYLPVGTPSDGPYYASNDGLLRAIEGHKGNDASGKWSSLIGVVTAICGNVLISFALNTQRYAHMRLGRDREEREEKHRSERRQLRKATDYGTNQIRIAEQRSRANAKSEPGEYSLEEPLDGAAETDPLIPSVDTLSSREPATSSGEAAGADETPNGAAKEKSYLRSPIWWLGIAMMTVGEAGNFLAYGFAPASIVSPMGVVALVSNCLIAPLLLHERFRWRDGLGVVVAVAGCVTVVLSANDSNPKLTPDAIWNLITQWEFETYLGITVFLIIALAAASNKFGEKTILIDVGLVALLGGYTALSTKGVASLLSNTIWRVVTFPITYLLVVVLVFTAVMQIKYINRALQRFSATVVIPTQFVLFTISVIVGSAILYRDFERTTGEDAAKFVGGCALTFLGVWVITSGRGNETSEDVEMDGDEDAINLIDEEDVQPEIRERDDDTVKRRPIATGSSSETTPFRRLHNSDSFPPTVLTPNTPPSPGFHTEVDDTPLKPSHGVSPAVAAAVHSAPEIIEPSEDAQRPSVMHATTSAPVVPTLDSAHSANGPNRRLSGPNPYPPTTPTTPTMRPSIPMETLGPYGPHKAVHRQSMVSLIPAPFTSPLSSSLSAVVADSLRRGVDRTPSAIRRRLRRPSKLGDSGKRQSVVNTAPPKRHSIASAEMAFDEAGPVDRTDRPKGRMRSLSATIGDIFGSIRKARPQSQERERGQDREQQEGRG